MCIRDSDNARRWDMQVPTTEVLRTYGSDYKCIFVGDASMSPYEILHPGGATEHWHPEAGQVWLQRACAQWTNQLWSHPVPEAHWGYTQSIRLIQSLFPGRMVPMTLDGIARGIKELR